jgi:hypothetical protein
MRLTLAMMTALGAMACFVGSGAAQELLTNGGLDNPGVHESDLATGWTLTEGPLNTAMPPALANSATFATFADRDGSGVGLWLRSFEGGLNATAPSQVFAHLTQNVPATAGLTYNLSAWARFETHYAGGVANLNDGAPEAGGESSTDGAASPTDTEFALEFRNAANAIITTVSKELLADGRTNGAPWGQHTVSGVAPVGTTSVTVRGSMLNGVINPGVNPQSAFFDDFSLTAVPEPSALALAALAAIGMAGRISRRR